MLTTSLIEEALPQRLPAAPRLRPEHFPLVCIENREALLELAADGRIIPGIPIGGERGARSVEIFFKLDLFVNRTDAWKASDSPTGFSLADQLSLAVVSHQVRQRINAASRS